MSRAFVNEKDGWRRCAKYMEDCMMTLINLADHSTVEMCKKLLTGKDLDYALSNDVPYYGDELIFSGELTNGLLAFWYNSPFDSNDNKYESLTYNRNTGDVGTY
ncbi:MAG: hypothetical protein AAGU27_21935 [Dehalobacterium sp.]